MPAHVTRRKPLPSLYTSYPTPPTFRSLSIYDTHRVRTADRKQLLHLGSLVDKGPCQLWLEEALEEPWKREIGRRTREDLKRKREEEKDQKKRDEEELKRKGFVHKGKAKRLRSESVASEGSQTSEGGLTEKEQEGEEGKGATGKEEKDEEKVEKRGGKRDLETSRLRREKLKIPKADIDDVVLPEEFPSTELLNSIHSHASSLFASRKNLLPPLTPSQPFLPRKLVRHFDNLNKSLWKQEKKAFKNGKKEEIKAWKKTRIEGTVVKGGRERAWTDVERGMEGTALVAMGMLSQLLVNDALQKASTRT